MFFRQIEIEGFSETTGFKNTFSLLSGNTKSLSKMISKDKNKDNGFVSLMKQKQYKPPRSIFIESKTELKSKLELPLYEKNLLWAKDLEEYDYRVILVYSTTAPKSNKAIYMKTYEDALKLSNFLLYQSLCEMGYSFAKKVSGLSIFFKNRASQLFAEHLATYSKAFCLKKKIESEKMEEINQEQFEKKQKIDNILKQISNIVEDNRILSIKSIFKNWQVTSLELKKKEEIEQMDKENHDNNLRKFITGDIWLNNIKKLVINESFVQKWLWTALMKIKTEQAAKKSIFRLSFVEIETPLSNWMELFKPMILVSGHFLPENLIVTSPSHSPLKSMALRKSNVLKTKSFFSLSSYDCFLRKKYRDKLIWDISPDEERPLKSTELEVIEHLIIEFLDEGNEIGFSFQKEKSHRLEISIELLKGIILNLKSEFFWFPLKRIQKMDDFSQSLFIKIKNLEFKPDRYVSKYFDEIFGSTLDFSFLDQIFFCKSSEFIECWLGEKLQINLLIENKRNLNFLKRTINEKYNELSIKSYWSIVVKFCDEPLNKDFKSYWIRQGLPNFIRRKLWGIKNKEKYIEITDYLLDSRTLSNKKANRNIDIKDIKPIKMLTDIEVYEKLLNDIKKNDYTNLIMKILDDKDLLNGLSKDFLEIVSEIIKCLTHWAKLNGKRLVYSRNLLYILINVLNLFMNDPLYLYYMKNPTINDWIFSLITPIKDVENKLKIPLEPRNLQSINEKIGCDCFWAMVCLFNDVLVDYYLISENSMINEVQSKKSKENEENNLKGIRGALIILRGYIQEFYSDIMKIFELNDGCPYGLELIFGDWFLNIMSTCSFFRKDLLFRLWDICFNFVEIFNDKIKYSALIVAVVAIIFKRTRPFLKNLKNYHDFQKFLSLYFLFLEKSDEFITEIISETRKVDEFISRKWHIWLDIEAELMPDFHYFKNYSHISATFFQKSREKDYRVNKNVEENKELPKLSLHLFLYDTALFHSENGLLIEMNCNNTKKHFKCLQARTHFSLNFYQNFPIDDLSKSLNIRIFSLEHENFIENIYGLSSNEEPLEEHLKNKEFFSGDTNICQQTFLNIEPEEKDAIFLLDLDLQTFEKGVLHKGIYKLQNKGKKSYYFCSTMELAVLIAENTIVSESYLVQEPHFFDEKTHEIFRFYSENEKIMKEILLKSYKRHEEAKNQGILKCERANNTFFVPGETYESHYIDYEEFLKRIKDCGFENESAISWVYEAVRGLNSKYKKKSEKKFSGLLLPEFASALFLISPEYGISFLMGKDKNNKINEKISIIRFKLFVKFLFRFVSLNCSPYYIENLIDLLSVNGKNNAKIIKAYLSLEENNPKTIRFQITDILREFSIVSQKKFGSKDILFEENPSILKEFCDILRFKQEYEPFFSGLVGEKIGILTIKYETVNNLRCKKVFKFRSNNYEIINENISDISLKPVESMFKRLMNSITFNGLTGLIEIEECKKLLSKIPLLDYFVSLNRVLSILKHNYLTEEVMKKEKIKLEISVNSSLFISFYGIFEYNSFKNFQRPTDYQFLASEWKYYWSQQYKSLLKFHSLSQEDEEDEDLSEKTNNEVIITTEPICAFYNFRELVMIIQRKILIALQEGLLHKNILFLRAVKASKSILMLDFFKTKLHVYFKNSKKFIDFSAREEELTLANFFNKIKMPILVFEYITPNIDKGMTENDGFFEMKYYNNFINENNIKQKYCDLAFFRHSDYSGEWMNATIVHGFLKNDKEKRIAFENTYNKSNLKKENFEYFEVIFQKYPNEIYIIRQQDIKFFNTINASNFYKKRKEI